MCLTFTDLGSVKHQTQAEVDDAIKVCEDAVQVHKSPIASIAVDNAAKAVAAKVADHLQPTMRTVVLRDPSHCVDLCSKDLASTSVVKKVMEEANEVHKFVRTDRIDSMRLEAAEEGVLEDSYAGQTMSETRMNGAHLFICGALKQANFLSALPRDQKWKDFLSERKPADRAQWEAKLKRCADQGR